jgi:hypothetical protein
VLWDTYAPSRQEPALLLPCEWAYFYHLISINYYLHYTTPFQFFNPLSGLHVRCAIQAWWLCWVD